MALNKFNSCRTSCLVILLVFMGTTADIPDRISQPSTFTPRYIKVPSTKLNKVSLTQKGYIQFLRYLAVVPPIGDFTFCIWMRSANLTYSHPLLSYSLHESERYIRSWITPGGDEIRLALKEIDVVRVHVGFKLNQWYHICQSWATKTGHWDLFLNGKLKAHGYNHKARGLILPKDGDIVVGQEYTDFDKGLDDGIEGDIFGFNMVLEPTVSLKKQQTYSEKPFTFLRRSSNPEQIKGHYIVETEPVSFRRTSKSVNKQEENFSNTEEQVITARKDTNSDLETVQKSEGPSSVENGQSLNRKRRQSFIYPSSYSVSEEEENFSNKKEVIAARKDTNSDLEELKKSEGPSSVENGSLNRKRRQSFIYPSSYISFFPLNQQKSTLKTINPFYQDQYAYRYQLPYIPEVPTARKQISRVTNDIPVYNTKPLGLQLVELSYDCSIGKGAPLKGKNVLISWTKTQVRVFGGAILKKVDAFCY